MAVPPGGIVARAPFFACIQWEPSPSASTEVSIGRPIIGQATGTPLLCAAYPVGQRLPFRVVL